MAQNPPAHSTRISACLFYDDLPAAIELLTSAFGFELRFSVPPNGPPAYAEIGLAESRVMLGNTQSPSPHGELKTPKSLGAWGSSLYVYVDDVDTHLAHARTHGATILDEPMDTFWGDRIYTALDAEHHFWTFATHVKDVDMANLTPPRD